MPYHVNVPSFGDWGFNMASERYIVPDDLKLSSNITYQYLNQSNYPSLFLFANDEKADMDKLEINTLFKPVLIGYYEKDIAVNS
ncbi:MAG: hypothetical protein ACK5KL_14680 [Dysgonomonas sp.]